VPGERPLYEHLLHPVPVRGDHRLHALSLAPVDRLVHKVLAREPTLYENREDMPCSRVTRGRLPSRGIEGMPLRLGVYVLR
jgi:hypothetical protein